MSRVFANSSRDRGSVPGRIIPKTQKKKKKKNWYLMPPCLTLSIIRQGSRVKWSNPGNGVAPPLHLSVVAIEKGAFRSPSSKVTNFTYLLLCMIFYLSLYLHFFLFNLAFLFIGSHIHLYT